MADVFCSTQIPEYQQLECGIERGGIVGLGLIASSESPSEANLEDASFWTTQLGLSPQLYFSIQNTRGNYPGGTPVEEEGFGLTPTTRTGADHEAIVEVQGIEMNRDFWAGVNQTQKWHAVLVTADGLMLYLRDSSVYSKLVLEQNIKSQVRWNVSIKWSDDLSNPTVLTAPDGIFAAAGAFA